MRYILSGCLCFSTLLSSSSLFAFQLQFRAFQSLASLSHHGGEVPVEWSGSYLNGTPQSTSTTQGGDHLSMNSMGYELSLGMELVYPHLFVDGGVSHTAYYPGPDQKVEDLAPKIGVQFITNVQDRWMPFARLGLSQHHLKLISNRVETYDLPASLNITDKTSDRFGVTRTWDDPRLWNADLSMGCKLYPVPTTAIVLEYRYSQSLNDVTIHETMTGTSSYANDAGFVSQRELPNVRLSSQEFSAAIEVEL